MSEGKMELNEDEWIGVVSLVNSIYWSIYVPTVPCGHEAWVITHRIRLLTAEKRKDCFRN